MSRISQAWRGILSKSSVPAFRYLDGNVRLRVQRSEQKKARPGSGLARRYSEHCPLVGAAATSRGAPGHQVAGRLAPGNGDANKLLHQRDWHCDASAILLLEHDSAFVGLQYAPPV